MRPLSFSRSKTMMPFLGQPLLEYLMNSLGQSGIRRITISSEGLHSEIRAHFGDGQSRDLSISYMPSRAWVGTAHVVSDWLAQNNKELPDTLIVIYGDSLLRMDLGAFVERHRQLSAQVSVLAHRADFGKFRIDGDSERTNYGIMDVACGRITRFEEKPLVRNINNFKDPWANGAVYAFEHDIFPRLCNLKSGETDFSRHVFPHLLHEGTTIQAIDIGAGYRVDLGTLELYLSAHVAALSGLMVCEPNLTRVGPRSWCHHTLADRSRDWSMPVALAERADVAPTAELDHATIGVGAVIRPHASIDRSVVLDGAKIGARTVVRRSVVGFGCTLGDGLVVEDAVYGERCELRVRTRLMPEDDFRGLLGTVGERGRHL
jgi:NDP-sugar pyrophosphorylase family protein